MSARLDKALRRFMRLDAMMLKARQIAVCGFACEEADATRIPCCDQTPAMTRSGGYDDDDVQVEEGWWTGVGRLPDGCEVAWWHNRFRNTREWHPSPRAEYDFQPMIDDWCAPCRRRSRFRWWQKFARRKRNGALTTLRAAWKAEASL